LAADPVLSRELKSLQEELSAPRAGQLSSTSRSRTADAGSTEVETAGNAAAAAPAHPPADAAEEQHLRAQLHEFVNEVTKFFDQAEKDIAAHPTQSVIGAMVVGILIGRLLARR